jgi:hypothetical protein
MDVVQTFPRSRRRITRLKHQFAARVTNGSDVLPGVDGRSIVARRYRDIASAILVDQGGEAECSESRKQLIRRFAAAAVLAEQLEAKLANGEKIDIAEHALLCSTLVRVARQIGVNRIARDITPSLGEYLSRKAHTRERDQRPLPNSKPGHTDFMQEQESDADG